MQQKDCRIQLTSELLNGIKVIKLYAWEDHFHSDVKDTRDNELSVSRIIAYLNAGLSFTWSSTLFLVKVCDDSTFEEYISTHVYAYTIIVCSHATCSIANEVSMLLIQITASTLNFA